MIVLVDGAPADDLRGAAFERALLYGDAVFESFRLEEGGVLALRARLERLARSAELMRMDVVVDQVRAELARAVERFGRLPAYGRVTLVRAPSPGLVASERACRRVVHVGVLQRPRAALTASTFRRENPLSVRFAKVASYADAAWTLERSGTDEVLGVDAEGHVLEGTVANVFAVVGDTLVTPSLAQAVLPGITRQLVLDAARARGHATVERAMRVHEVYTASEVFVTSSVRGVVRLASLDGRPLGDTGVAAELEAALRDLPREPLRVQV